jgi:hypothetical protein
VRRLAIATIAVSVLAWSGPATADCNPEGHLSTCLDADNLWPHAGAAYFNFVGGATTTLPRTFAVGLVATYLRRPIVLVAPSADPSGAEVVAVRDLVDTTLLFSLGITDRLDAGVALPLAAYRSGYGISALTSQQASPIARTAMRDVRIGGTLRLFGCSSPSSCCSSASSCDVPVGIAARVELSLPTGDESSFAGDSSPVLAPSLSGEVRAAPFVGGAELGARIRRTADLAGSRVGPQLHVGLGFGVDVVEEGKLGFLLEAMAFPTLVAQDELSLDRGTGERVVTGNRPILMPAEWQAGVRSANLLLEGASLMLGAGGPVQLTGESGITTPSYRVTMSIRYVPRPEDTVPR